MCRFPILFLKGQQNKLKNSPRFFINNNGNKCAQIITSIINTIKQPWNKISGYNNEIIWKEWE